jgi:hypothetical protein
MLHAQIPKSLGSLSYSTGHLEAGAVMLDLRAAGNRLSARFPTQN